MKKISRRTTKNAAWIAVGVLLIGTGYLVKFLWPLAILGVLLVALAWKGLRNELWGW
jgi:hypothetical protein